MHTVARQGLVRAYDDGYSRSMESGNSLQRSDKPCFAQVRSSWTGSDVAQLSGERGSDLLQRPDQSLRGSFGPSAGTFQTLAQLDPPLRREISGKVNFTFSFQCLFSTFRALSPFA